MYIASEIAPLKKVILNRPKVSLNRLTPSNCKELLFDDVLWPERAGEEHDAFSATLKDQGVETYLVGKLLYETLDNPKAREYLINNIFPSEFKETTIEEWARKFLLLTPNSQDIIDYILGGFTINDLRYQVQDLPSKALSPTDFILPPLPNLLFTRDSSTWIKDGLSINCMTYPARRSEIFIMATIYKYHPMFKDIEILYDSTVGTNRASIEGGDIQVLSEDYLFIGLSQRTKPHAVQRLAHALFERGKISHVIAVELPKQRATMHLDTMLTMLDHDTFCTIIDKDTPIRSWIIQPSSKRGELSIKESKDFFGIVSKAIGVKNINLVTVGTDAFNTEREQWTDGSNLLTVKPGVVVGYECNTETNKKLKNEGIEVLPIPSGELGRGRGGSHCMSCPILRE